MSLRSSKTDRRYLDDTENAALKATNVEARQKRNEKRVRARRGALAYQRNRPKNTTTRRPGSGGVGAGNAQAIRSKEASRDKLRSKSFRPEDPS